MNRNTFIALIAAGTLLALAAACGGGGGPDITVEKGLQATGGVPVEAVSREGFAFGPAGTSGFAGPAGDAFTVLQQGGLTGITGQGFGRATVAADSATVQFFVQQFFEGPFPVEAPPFDGEPFPEEFPEPEPFTEEDLAPIIDALLEQGVSEDDIEVIISPDVGGRFGPPGTAQVRAKVREPAGKLEPLVEAAREAGKAIEGLSFFDISVSYAVDDCTPLEREALGAAIEDAEESAQLLADALGKSLADLVFATESVFSPFAPSPCDPSAFGFEEFEFFGGLPFDPSQPAEVQLVSNVNLTFAFE